MQHATFLCGGHGNGAVFPWLDLASPHLFNARELRSPPSRRRTLWPRASSPALCVTARKARANGQRLFPAPSREAGRLSLEPVYKFITAAPLPADELPARHLPEDYLKQIAEYFAAQRPPLPAPAVPTVSKGVLERGESSLRMQR